MMLELIIRLHQEKNSQFINKFVLKFSSPDRARAQENALTCHITIKSLPYNKKKLSYMKRDTKIEETRKQSVLLQNFFFSVILFLALTTTNQVRSQFSGTATSSFEDPQMHSILAHKEETWMPCHQSLEGFTEFCQQQISNCTGYKRLESQDIHSGCWNSRSSFLFKCDLSALQNHKMEQ